MPIPGMPMLMGGQIASLKYLSSSISPPVGATVNIPSGVVAGDLLVMMDAGGSFINPPGALNPAGWTGMGNTTSGKTRVQSRYKIAQAGDAGASMATLGALGGTAIIVAFRGRKPILGITPSSVGQQGTTGNPTPQTVSSGGVSGPLVSIGIYVANAVVDPRSFQVGGVEAKDGEVGNPLGGDTYLAWKIFPILGQDCVIDMDDEGEQHMHSFYLQVSSW